jgi:selenocysteine lyase/cysteine desulfurase
MPTLAIYGLHAALGLLLDTGLEPIAERILQLTAGLSDGLVERGWQLHSPRAHDEERSGIVCASHPSLPADEVTARLGEAGVSVAPRGAGVRFSPHGWNTMAEVALVLERLP